MAEQRAEQRMDERLTALMEVERSLEARVQAREAAAKQKVDRARVALLAAQSERPPGLEEALAEEERADQLAHAAAIEALTAARQEALARFEGATEQEIDALAQQALRRVLGDGRPP